MNETLDNVSKVAHELMLPVQQLQTNPWNRKSFDVQGMQELTESIKAKGILEPLIVRKMLDGKYQIASGERRWKAALQAGLKEVPCRDMELSDEEVQDAFSAHRGRDKLELSGSGFLSVDLKGVGRYFEQLQYLPL